MPPSCKNAERPDAATRLLALVPTARLIATALLAGIVVFAVPAGAGASADGDARDGARPTARTAAAAPDDYDRALLRELNRVRATFKLRPLRYDARISRSADAHSRAQARDGVIAHGSWNGRVSRAAGYPQRVGEVLAWLGRDEAEAEAEWVVRGWLDSSTHRPLVLDRDFRRAGLGRALGVLDGVAAAVHTVDFATAR